MECSSSSHEHTEKILLTLADIRYPLEFVTVVVTIVAGTTIAA